MVNPPSGRCTRSSWRWCSAATSSHAADLRWRRLVRRVVAQGSASRHGRGHRVGKGCRLEHLQPDPPEPGHDPLGCRQVVVGGTRRTWRGPLPNSVPAASTSARARSPRRPAGVEARPLPGGARQVRPQRIEHAPRLDDCVLCAPERPADLTADGRIAPTDVCWLEEGDPTGVGLGLAGEGHHDPTLALVPCHGERPGRPEPDVRDEGTDLLPAAACGSATSSSSPLRRPLTQTSPKIRTEAPTGAASACPAGRPRTRPRRVREHARCRG